jgi:CheY-like chemotaxis protein
MRSIVQKLLAQLGYTDVDEAPDGAAALAKINEKSYGLVISDWNMEPMNGQVLLERVRANKKFTNLPFIMMTAESDRRAPKGRPPVTDPLAEPAAGHTPSRPEAPHAELKFDARFESEVDDKPELKFEPKEEPRPQLAARAESKPELAPAAPKKLHDNLEEEMANLLGRPPRKS